MRDRKSIPSITLAISTTNFTVSRYNVRIEGMVISGMTLVVNVVARIREDDATNWIASVKCLGRTISRVPQTLLIPSDAFLMTWLRAVVMCWNNASWRIPG